MRVMNGLGRDLRLAVRRLVATPLFTVFAVLSLAVGLAVTTAAYSVVSSLFFTSSGIPEEERLVSVMTTWEGRPVNGGLSTADVEELRASVRSFDGMTAYALIHPAVTTPGGTDLLRAEAVDEAYFPTLGVRPQIGRPVQAHDVTASAPVVVISHALWTYRYDSDPSFLGQRLRIGGQWFEVIGVAPKEFAGFGGPFRGTHVWLPVTAVPREFASGMAWNDRDRPRFMAVGRLAPQTEMATASTELSAVGAALDVASPKSSRYPGPQKRAWSARPVNAQGDQGVMAWRLGVVLVALVALVLVVACTNLANLILARGTMRQQEFAVRRAIGASRWRLIREQCAESLLIGLGGAAAAWALFSVLARAMDVDLPIGGKLLISFAPSLDATSLTVAAAALFISLFVFGLEPALQLTRDRDLRGGLAASAGSVGVPKAKRQRTLVRWQVAISTGFFIIATLCVKYTIAEARHDSGIDMDRVAVATMNFGRQQWDDTRARRAVSRLLEEIQQDPAVESAAVADGVPFGSTGTRTMAMSTTDKPFDGLRTFPWGPAIAATPRYFQTLGIRIVVGRGFDDRDHAGATPVVVLSERTARKLFGTREVVGRQMLIKPMYAGGQPRSVARKLALPTPGAKPAIDAPRTVTIVGVASDTDVVHLFSTIGDVLYLPLEQQNGSLTFAIAVVRTAGDPYAGVRVLRDAIGRTDPDLAVESSGTALGTLGGPTIFLRGGSMFAIGLGVLTLLLAMVGLYGVQSHGVAHRTREIGVRMSFGATAAQIRALVLKDGYRPVVQGIAIGIFIGFVGRGLVRAFLSEAIELVDPWMFVLVPIPLLLAAFFACYWPARRASRVDPNVALRHL